MKTIIVLIEFHFLLFDLFKKSLFSFSLFLVKESLYDLILGSETADPIVTQLVSVVSV